jgi:putative DNA primase/helicase
LSDDDLRLLAALRTIPKDAKSGKHRAAQVIGLGLRHNVSDIDEEVGLLLAKEWDRVTCGYSVPVFKASDPNYSATAPITKASIFDLAKKHGWQGEIPWRKPSPLAAKVEPEPYPLDALPLPIRAAVKEVAAFVKAPVPMVASSALAALSPAIQAHAEPLRNAP